MPDIVKKVWGKELIYKNDENYCVKLLFVEQGKCCSIHFHKDKTESFLARTGQVLLEVWEQLPEDYTEKDVNELARQKPQKRLILEPHSDLKVSQNSFITIEPRVPHRFYGLSMNDNTFFEASTLDKKNDSYRAIESMGLYKRDTNN